MHDSNILARVSPARELSKNQSTELVEPPLVDLFPDDRPAGRVAGSACASEALRRVCDAENQVAIDHGALRFKPLITPGWGRQGISYGPFRRAAGLVLAVSITNGHNTSQGGPIPERFVKRILRWAVGPNADPILPRMLAWARGPRRKGTLRRFHWWLRSTARAYKLPKYNENLAIGWFRTEAPTDPLTDGCGFIMHAAEGDNGELWTRVGGRCLRAFRRLKNLQIIYLVALRKQGAIYYASSIEGAYGLAAFPMMRPVAIDAFNEDAELFAGVHQCALGQIGFRVDTRIHAIRVQQVPELGCGFGTANIADSLTGSGDIAGTSALGGTWQVPHGAIKRTALGVTANLPAFAVLDSSAPSGLIHVLVETDDSPGAVGLAWRFKDHRSYWLLTIGGDACALTRVENGKEQTIATDIERRLHANKTHSVQILDAHGQIGCFLDGERLFDDRHHLETSEEEGTGIGLRFSSGNIRVRNLEAHPRAVPIPPALALELPRPRFGTHAVYVENFAGPPGELAGRSPTLGEAVWEKTQGVGALDVDGSSRAKVRASVERPHPGRTFYTLPWNSPEFSDLEITITPPGTRRGEKQSCRCGLVFWQDHANSVSITTWLDDVYEGASISVFTKRHGFEELYDAIWTNVSDKVFWGKPFRLRIVCDGERFNIFVDDEPIMQRAFVDIYPDDPSLRIARVGIAVNWEWGNDTGSIIEEFVARK